MNQKTREKRRKNVRRFVCKYMDEICKIENIILRKINGKDIKRVIMYSALNSEMFPSYRIALDKDDSLTGSIFECHLFYEDETDFSELSKKDIKKKKITFSVHFEEPGNMEAFDDIGSVLDYIDKNFKKEVTKKYAGK